ncbi:hypothetical protein JHL17_11310 [Azospirillum sp. YIM B02556]|uniref:Uncharacterized protein n=1 Tax=Azospirillum endophyticum TaxID=2800326 RepID=A0ABS1F3L0_9PROT|nr:hypothetical protein [Azospirillum endophyticum]MBK1838001.1 hypothetical protein [Azospirillum endophyticum]
MELNLDIEHHARTQIAAVVQHENWRENVIAWLGELRTGAEVMAAFHDAVAARAIEILMELATADPETIQAKYADLGPGALPAKLLTTALDMMEAATVAQTHAVTESAAPAPADAQTVH